MEVYKVYGKFIVASAGVLDNFLIRIGSETAKGSFANEKAIAKKFGRWKKDCQKKDAKVME